MPARDNKDLEERLMEMECEDSVILSEDDFASAAIGVSDDGNVIYDFDLMVQWLMEHYQISDDDARDDISYNVLGMIGNMPDPKPIVMYPLIDFPTSGDKDRFLDYLDRRISETLGIYNNSERGARKKNINATLMALRSVRNKYLEVIHGKT